MISQSRKPSASTAGPWGVVRMTMRDSQTWISHPARLTHGTTPRRAPWLMEDIGGPCEAITLCACRQSPQHDDRRELRSVQGLSDGVVQSQAIAVTAVM